MSSYKVLCVGLALLNAAATVSGHSIDVRIRWSDPPIEDTDDVSLDMNQDTLRQVTVVMRHGERAPADTYPNDPYVNSSMEPFGWGQLTNKGRKNVYRTGEFLRKRYGEFLGNAYSPHKFWLQTSSIDRTRMTGMILSAALWKPNKEQSFMPDINWQPVFLHYWERLQDRLLIIWNACPRLTLERMQVENMTKIKCFNEENKKLFDELANLTGLPMTNAADVASLYSTLKAEAAMDLPLPEWTKDFFPERLEEVASFSLLMNVFTNNLLKLAGGPLVTKILKSMTAKSLGTLKPESRKMYVYVGHDSTLANMLSAMRVWDGHNPDFGCTIMVELHEVNDNYNVQAESEDEIEHSPPNKKARQRDQFTKSEYRRRSNGEKGYLDDLLKRYNLGNALKSEYKNNSCLSDKSSLLLCDLIVSDLIIDCSSKLTSTDFSDLAEEILEIFPSEIKCTYFIPPVSKQNSKFKKSQKARGRLVNMFYNKLKRYRRMCGYSAKFAPDNSSAGELSVDVQQSLLWLKHNRVFPDIKTHWHKTSKIRHEELVNSSLTVEDYLNRYPALKDPVNGFTLIDVDFESLFESDAASIFEKWDDFFKKLIGVTTKKKPTTALSKLQLVLNELDIDQHSKHFVQLLMLAHLVPARDAKCMNKRGPWKPTTAESQDSFAIHVKREGDIESTHQEKVAAMFALGSTVQPYIIGLGDTLCNVTSFYVVVDKLMYRFDSALRALDICFKIFFTWHTGFPIQSHQIWLLIQHGLYNFKTNEDEPKPHVAKIVQKMSMEKT